MGPRVMRRLPKFVHGFIDRHGKPRFYFRRAGHKKLPLPGLPWSPEFMAAYQDAIEGAPRVEIGANRSRTGTVAAAVAGYFGSASFAMGLADSTRRTRRRILERFREQHGDKGIATLGKVHVERMVNAKAGTPGDSAELSGRHTGSDAARNHGRLAGRRPDYRRTGPKVPLRGVLHLDRGGHCGLRGEASQWAPKLGLRLRCCCTRLSAAQTSCGWAVSTSARACYSVTPSQDRDHASDPAAPRTAGGIRRHARREHDVSWSPATGKPFSPGRVHALVQAQVHARRGCPPGRPPTALGRPPVGVWRSSGAAPTS